MAKPDTTDDEYSDMGNDAEVLREVKDYFNYFMDKGA